MPVGKRGRLFWLCLSVFVLAAILVGVFSVTMVHKSGANPLGVSSASATVHGVSLTLELATTSQKRAQGLSGRTSVPEKYGMLFVFPNPGIYGFWMKDMLVPLDLFWLNDKGQVVSFQNSVATDTYPNVFEPTEPALYVLETRAGFAKEYRVATGTTVDLKNIPNVSE